MENHQFPIYQTHTSAGQLKESIRDMIRIQRDYQIPDELFWEIFNTRVLQNEPIDISACLGILTNSASQS